MAKITKEQVEHVAKLSRLELSEKELEKYTREFSEILGYVEKLNSVDTKDVEAINQISGLENISRDDSIQKSLSVEEILSNAPEKQDGFFKVKKVL